MYIYIYKDVHGMYKWWRIILLLTTGIGMLYHVIFYWKLPKNFQTCERYWRGLTNPRSCCSWSYQNSSWCNWCWSLYCMNIHLWVSWNGGSPKPLVQYSKCLKGRNVDDLEVPPFPEISIGSRLGLDYAYGWRFSSPFQLNHPAINQGNTHQLSDVSPYHL